MLVVGGLACQLGANDGDNRPKGVGKTVYGVKRNGNGACRVAYHYLHCCEHNVSDDVYGTCSYDFALSFHVRSSVVPCRYRRHVS